MLNVKLLDRILLLVLTVGAPLAVAVLAGLGPEVVRRWVLAATVPVNLWVVIALGAGALYLVNRVTFIERQRRLALQAALEAVQAELKSSVGALQRDVVTGIPNQVKLEADLAEIAASIHRPDVSQLVMIDLDGFGAVNDRFGYQKGDELIRAIAQAIHGSMRRDEEAYKRPFAGSTSVDDLWRRIYRKYSGGDEFVFLLSGAEPEALGFLMRLQRRFEAEFTPKAAEILGAPWPVSFHAGVCPLYPGDSFDAAIQRVEECLRLARQSGSASRVYWMSHTRAADLPESNPAASAYAAAEKAFAIAP